MDYVPVFENVEKIPPQVSVSYVEPLHTGVQYYEKVSKDGKFILDASNLEDGVVLARASDHQAASFHSLYGGLSRDSSNEEFAHAMADYVSAVFKDLDVGLVLDTFDKNVALLQQVGNNAKMYTDMVYGGKSVADDSFSEIRDDALLGFSFASSVSFFSSKFSGSSVMPGQFFKDMVRKSGEYSPLKFGDRSGIVLVSFGAVRKYHDNEKEINDLALSLMRQDKSLSSFVSRFESFGKKLDAASKDMVVSVAAASVANSYEISKGLVSRLEDMNGSIRSFHVRYGDELKRNGLSDARSILTYDGNKQLKEDFLSLNSEIKTVCKDVCSLREQIKSSDSFLEQNARSFSDGNLKDLKARNLSVCKCIDVALGDSGKDSLFGRQVTGSLKLSSLFSDEADVNMSFMGSQDASSGEFSYSELGSKEEALDFMQAVGSDCLRRGIENKDRAVMQLGRTIHAYQKRLADSAYDKAAVVTIMCEIAKNEPVRIGNLESIYHLMRQKKEQTKSNLVEVELDLSGIRSRNENLCRGSR